MRDARYGQAEHTAAAISWAHALGQLQRGKQGDLTAPLPEFRLGIGERSRECQYRDDGHGRDEMPARFAALPIVMLLSACCAAKVCETALGAQLETPCRFAATNCAPARGREALHQPSVETDETSLQSLQCHFCEGGADSGRALLFFEFRAQLSELLGETLIDPSG